MSIRSCDTCEFHNRSPFEDPCYNCIKVNNLCTQWEPREECMKEIKDKNKTEIFIICMTSSVNSTCVDFCNMFKNNNIEYNKITYNETHKVILICNSNIVLRFRPQTDDLRYIRGYRPQYYYECGVITTFKAGKYLRDTGAIELKLPIDVIETVKERINTKMNHDEINFVTGDMKILKVETEVINGDKYIHFIYDYKDSYKKGELHIVCYLPTSVNYPVFVSDTSIAKDSVTRVNLGLGNLHVKVYRLENIEYNIKEMTIEQIEEKLGHKVKIVGEDK